MGKKNKEHEAALPEVDPREAIPAFEKEIANQENILYGMALFFEGLTVLKNDSPEMIEISRKQFQGVIQASQASIESARSLLDQVRKMPAKAGLQATFQFAPCEGHPQPGEMVKRARMLVRAYEEIFPNRSRAQPFAESEVFRLMEAASEKLE